MQERRSVSAGSRDLALLHIPSLFAGKRTMPHHIVLRMLKS